MHVWPLLPFFIHSISLVLYKLRECPYGTVCSDGQGRQIAATVISHHHPFATGINGHVAGIIASAGLFIKEFELSCFVIECKSAYSAGLCTVRFIHCIEKMSLRSKGQVRGVLCLRYTDRLCIAGGGIKFIYIDSLAVLIRVGIGAYEKVII